MGDGDALARAALVLRDERLWRLATAATLVGAIMRSIGGLGYLVLVALIAIAIDRMAVSLYDSGSIYRHTVATSWAGHSATPAAKPSATAQSACVKASMPPCPTAMAVPPTPAPAHDPLDSVSGLWAVIRRL
jgi:hypothetical protein